MMVGKVGISGSPGIHFQVNQPLVFGGGNSPVCISASSPIGTCRDLRLLYSHQQHVKAAVPVNIAGMARAMVGFNFDMTAK